MAMIVHVYSSYPATSQEASRRRGLAVRTWKMQPWEERPVADGMVRMFKDGIRSVPYLKDVFRVGCSDLTPYNIVVYTNSDICVRSDACSVISEVLRDRDACYAFRRDFDRLTDVLPDSQISNGNSYCGTDLFAFRVHWWKTHGNEFPDMLLGSEAWDAVMRVLVETHNPKGGQSGIADLIYHERHPSVWEDGRNRWRIDSQKHNLRLACVWLKDRGLNPEQFGIRRTT